VQVGALIVGLPARLTASLRLGVPFGGGFRPSAIMQTGGRLLTAATASLAIVKAEKAGNHDENQAFWVCDSVTFTPPVTTASL